MNKKISITLAFSVIIILAILVAGISFYLWREIKTENGSLINLPIKNKMVACTEEAKLCPDGSAVGRTAPNCEFAPCPEIVGIANKIIITSLKSNDVVSSPLSILGKAVGGWFFEADFPIEIYDGNDKKIGSKYCSFSPKTENETWMTEEFVDFKCELQFEKPKTDSGYIIFKKNNPSDMRELDEEFKLPVRFGGVNSGIVNPASVFCEKNGGTIEIRTDENGGQIGICKLANGFECEEWEYYKTGCPLDFGSNM